MTDADRFLQILSKNFPRLKFPSKRRRFVSGWVARSNTIAGDDTVFRAGVAGFPVAVVREFYERGGPLCVSHGVQPVGRTVSYQVVPAGLWLVAEVAQGNEGADDAWRQIITGKMAGFSLRWQTDPAGDVLIGGLHFARAARIIEVSLAERPSEPEAGFRVGRYENPTVTPTIESPSIRSRIAARARHFLQEITKR